MKFYIYRWKEGDQSPAMQLFDIDIRENRCIMLLDALEFIKTIDSSLAFRRSCGEGVCGSDGLNVNGKNRLACITPLKDLKEPVMIRPLPGMPVIRDLIVDLTQFYDQYKKIKPFLQPKDQEL